jgi:hypothetical protein
MNMSKRAVDEGAKATSKIQNLEDAIAISRRAFSKLRIVSRAIRNFSCELGDEMLPAPMDDELRAMCEQLREYEARLEVELRGVELCFKNAVVTTTTLTEL